MGLMKRIFSLTLLIFVPTFGARAETISDFLKSFHADPYKEMQRLPPRVNEDGEMISRGYINPNDVEEKLQDKNDLRLYIMGKDKPRLFADVEDIADDADKPERLIDPGNIIRNIVDLEQKGLTRYVMPEKPWTDSYWPLYKGNLGHRYSDPNFPNSTNWSTNYSYVQSFPAYSVSLNMMSPSEKYDYVVGDGNFTLTKFSWNQGRRRLEQFGYVAKWMGICHGWSAASHMGAKFPEKPVVVTAVNGAKVTFYPQDIKALQSMLWANANVSTRFVGDRCNVSRPKKNVFGRIIDQKCFDVNPGTWHIAITNQLGLNKRSFVMDGTYDGEVWNFPLFYYKYGYFHPQSLQQTQTAKAAAVPIEKFRLDKFREFRSPRAKYVIGIFMDVSYVKEINPTRKNIVEPPIDTVRYVYDLELDENMNIVGGEWYTNAHPDFIWTYDKNAQALAFGEDVLSSEGWTYLSRVPSSWASIATKASNKGTPLFSFIKGIVEQSSSDDSSTTPPAPTPPVPPVP